MNRENTILTRNMMQNVCTFFQQNSLFFSRLGFKNAPSRLDDARKLIQFIQDYDGCQNFITKCNKLADTSILDSFSSCWIGPDTNDYSLRMPPPKAFFDKVPESSISLASNSTPPWNGTNSIPAFHTLLPILG